MKFSCQNSYRFLKLSQNFHRSFSPAECRSSPHKNDRLICHIIRLSHLGVDSDRWFMFAVDFGEKYQFSIWAVKYFEDI